MQKEEDKDRRATVGGGGGVAGACLAVLYILCTDVHSASLSPAPSYVFTLHVCAVIAPLELFLNLQTHQLSVPPYICLSGLSFHVTSRCVYY